MNPWDAEMKFGRGMYKVQRHLKLNGKYVLYKVFFKIF